MSESRSAYAQAPTWRFLSLWEYWIIPSSPVAPLMSARHELPAHSGWPWARYFWAWKIWSRLASAFWWERQSGWGCWKENPKESQKQRKSGSNRWPAFESEGE